MRKLFISIFIILFLLFISSKSFATEIKKGIENFPNSYKPYLQELKNKHPNWEFSALYTELDFNQVILNEYGNGSNLVPIGYNDRWKSTDPRNLQCRNR